MALAGIHQQTFTTPFHIHSLTILSLRRNAHELHGGTIEDSCPRWNCEKEYTPKIILGPASHHFDKGRFIALQNPSAM
jgi:hypothetical protein